SYDPFAVGVLKDCSAIGPEWNLEAWAVEIFACLATPAFLLVFLLGATLYIGASSKSTRVDDEDREWWSRLGAWVLIVILAWIVATGLVIFGPIALLAAPGKLASLGGISGVLAAVIGKSAKSGGSKSQNGSAVSGLMNAVMSKALPLLAVIFIGVLLVSLSL